MLTTPQVQEVGQAECEDKVGAGDVNWLHESNSRSDLYCQRTESVFPLDLELEDSAYNHLEASKGGKDAYLKEDSLRLSQNPDD